MMWLPVLGWILASEIAKDRLRPIRRHLEQRLAARPECTETFWGRDDRRARLASFVRRSIQESFAWPNDRFIPADPIELACFNDDGELFDIIEDAARQLGLPDGCISPNDLGEIGRTDIGNLVNWLLDLADRSTAEHGKR